MTPDINVLVAASRSDHPHHTVALRRLEAAIGGPAAGGTLTLMPKVPASFLRLVTSPGIFQQATPSTMRSRSSTRSSLHRVCGSRPWAPSGRRCGNSASTSSRAATICPMRSCPLPWCTWVSTL
jgi:hypothetical protein